MSVPSRKHVQAGRCTRGAPHALLLTLAVLLVSCGSPVVVGKEEQASTPSDAGRVRESGPRIDAGEILCGSAVCGPIDLGAPIGGGGPCCYGRSGCGFLLATACVELSAKGVDDPSCSSLPPFPGCCRLDGSCGLGVGGPLGCISPPLLALGTCVYPDQ